VGYDPFCRLLRLGEVIKAGKGGFVVIELVSICNGCCVDAGSGRAKARSIATNIKANEHLIILTEGQNSNQNLEEHITFDRTKSDRMPALVVSRAT
jgi:hypothetical protein